MNLQQPQKIKDDVYLFRDKLLGGGAYGRVYKGKINSQSKLIAIKQIITNEQVLLKQQAQLWFFETMKVKHQNILQYYGSHIKKNTVYLFIELCKGGTLATLIKKNGQVKNQLSQLKVLLLFQQLLEGMVFLNKHEIIHRDLKPQNILLDDMQRLKIGDFGTARKLIDMTKTDGSKFTPLYASPQVLLDGEKDYTANRDVWSAGLILYQMLTGKAYFNMHRDINSLKVGLQKLKKKKPIIQIIPNNLCQQWIQILNSMLVFDYKKRPYFEDVLCRFRNLRKQLLKKIHKKYNIQDQNLGGTLMTSTIGSMQKTQQSQNFGATFRQEISRDVVIDIRSYLIFFFRKNQFMYLQFMNALKMNPSSYILNLFKYCLIVISWAHYHNLLTKIIKQLSKFRIQLPQNRIVQKKDFVKWHQTQVQILLTEFKQRFQSRQTQISDLLKRQIIPLILKKIQQKDSDKNAFKQRILKKIPNFLEILTQLKKKVNHFENYHQYFVKLASCSTIYVRNLELCKINSDDFQAYLKIRMICNIDKVFPYSEFHNIDFIFSEKQRISNLTFEQKLEYIQKYNERLDLGSNSSVLLQNPKQNSTNSTKNY